MAPGFGFEISRLLVRKWREMLDWISCQRRHQPMQPLPSTRGGQLQRPDGASIAYEVTGSGRALLFAHGIGGNLLSWWQQIPFFARNYTCIAFSQRGFGASKAPPGGPKLADFPDDTIALLDHLKIDKAVYIGQSMGGWTGVELTLANPERVAALVLSNTTGTLDFTCYGDAKVAQWLAAQPKRVGELAAAGVHPATSTTFAQEHPALHALYFAIERLNDQTHRAALFEQLRASRVRGPDAAKDIACPVLGITGENDFTICPDGVRVVTSQMKNARFVEVPVSGHSVYFERADIFNAKLTEFLVEIGWV
jgi:pimeloyl-ACP methyl ester carboxylesterase